MGQRDKTGAVVKCRVSKITIPWAWGRWTGDGNGGQRVAFPLMLQRSRWCLPWAEGVMPGASETRRSWGWDQVEQAGGGGGMWLLEDPSPARCPCSLLAPLAVTVVSPEHSY